MPQNTLVKVKSAAFFPLAQFDRITHILRAIRLKRLLQRCAQDVRFYLVYNRSERFLAIWHDRGKDGLELFRPRNINFLGLFLGCCGGFALELEVTLLRTAFLRVHFLVIILRNLINVQNLTSTQLSPFFSLFLATRFANVFFERSNSFSCLQVFIVAATCSRHLSDRRFEARIKD